MYNFKDISIVNPFKTSKNEKQEPCALAWIREDLPSLLQILDQSFSFITIGPGCIYIRFGCGCSYTLQEKEIKANYWPPT